MQTIVYKTALIVGAGMAARYWQKPADPDADGRA